MIPGGRLIVGIVTIALSLFLLVAWSPAYIQTVEGDPAYTYAYHYLFSLGAQYGLDVVHTGGPWSVIYYQDYHPATFLLLLAGQSVTAIVLAMALLLAVLRHPERLVIQICVVLAVLAFGSAVLLVGPENIRSQRAVEKIGGIGCRGRCGVGHKCAPLLIRRIAARSGCRPLPDAARRSAGTFGCYTANSTGR